MTLQAGQRGGRSGCRDARRSSRPPSNTRAPACFLSFFLSSPVLDMVTDRVATTCLLALLCVVYPAHHLPCLLLIMLDISRCAVGEGAGPARGGLRPRLRRARPCRPSRCSAP